MACPSCGCKVHYQFNTEADFAQDDERLERCAACGAVFDIEDSADDEDDDESAASVSHPQAKDSPSASPSSLPAEQQESRNA